MLVSSRPCCLDIHVEPLSLVVDQREIGRRGLHLIQLAPDMCLGRGSGVRSLQIFPLRLKTGQSV